MFCREVGTTIIRGIFDKNKAETPSKKRFWGGHRQGPGRKGCERPLGGGGGRPRWRGGLSGVRGGNNAGGGQRGREACGGNKKSSIDVVTQESEKMVA